MEKFQLSEKFINKYKRKKPPFGFNGLGELVYMRTYSRIKDNGKNERWWETIQRVIEGTYSMQKNWIDSHQLGWNPWQAQRSAQEMYDRMFNMKFLPPGRGLWAMGTAITEEKNLYAALNNCAFVSTKTLKEDYSKPFTFLMDASMLGVGVGFDTKGAGEVMIKLPNPNRGIEEYEIPDTREGWVESLKLLLESYFHSTAEVQFDYSKIRPEGEPIKGFGGVSSGHEPLQEIHEEIRKVLNRNVGEPITITTIVDVMNLIGKCVVAGNVRRTAEIVFGDPHNEEYLDLKNYKVNKHRETYGWTSNNSIFAELGMDYTDVCKRINDNGEPGLAWLENMRTFSRMQNGGDNKDHRVAGGNPCVVGDTLVAVADGRNSVPIRDLVDTQYPVYSVDENGKVVIKHSIKTWKTKENTEIWKLTLDDGSYLLATPDHKIMLRGGEYKELKDLREDESVFPFNSFNNKGYRNIRGTGKRASGIRQYRLITESEIGYMPNAKEYAIHHKDFDKTNDVWDNLDVITQSEHSRLHRLVDNPMHDPINVEKMKETTHNNGGHYGKRNGMYGKNHKKSTLKSISKKSSKNWENQRDFMIESIKNGMTDKVRKHISDKRKERTIWVDWKCPVCNEHKTLTEYQASNRKTCSYSCSNVKRGMVNNGIWNHKVVSVEFHGYEDVYDMTVEDTHNFGVITSTKDGKYLDSSGLFIHNCLEQSLESYELCCLVETFPSNHDSLEDYQRTLKYAYLYAKTVTLGKTHWPDTNRVMLRNRRIGCSVSGVAQFITKHGMEELRKWLEKGYKTIHEWDCMYSDWFAIPKSIKTTSVKPSGTVSLLVGATPGMHYPESRFYIRRMRLSKHSELIGPLKKAGYKIEPAFGSEDATMVVEVPVDVGEGIRTAAELSIWEQFSLAAFLQRHWADNQVSCTATFDPETEADELPHVLNYFQYRLKGISLLPRHPLGAYKQMPYEAITEKEYNKQVKKLGYLSFVGVEGEEAEVDLFCNNDSCEIPPLTGDVDDQEYVN
jgi:ribonucleotide reductase alpha subunit